MDSKLLIPIIAIIVLVVLASAYFGGIFEQLAFATVDGKTVVVPRLGSVICEDTGQWKTTNYSLLTRQAISASVPASQSCPGMPYNEALILRNECYAQCGFDPFGFCTSVCDQAFIDVQSYRTISTLPWRDGFHPAAMIYEFTCNTTRCKIFTPSFGLLSTFWSENNHKIFVNSVPRAGANLKWNGTKFCENYFPFDFTPIGSAPVTLNQGDTATIMAFAYRDSSIPNFYGDNLTATTSTVAIQDVISRLAVYADGTKFFKANTEGCKREDVIGLINYGDYPLYQQNFNLYTDETGQIKTGLLEVTLPKMENLPTHLDPGAGWTFVFEWKGMSTLFGNVREYQGQSVWVDKITNNVYRLETITTANGTSYVIPTEKILSNVECFENMECVSKYGTGYFCGENFQCDILPPECVSDIQCTTYPIGTCLTIGGKYYNMSGGGCVGGKCAIPTQTEVKCCPGICGPNLTCDPAIGCVDTGCEIQACPGECCVEDPCYVQKNCPAGFHCATVGTSPVGFCTQDFFCGDGKCTPEIGEDAANCRKDCHVCGNGICEPLDPILCPTCDETPENCNADCAGPTDDIIADLLNNSFFWIILALIIVIVSAFIYLKYFRN